MVGDVAMLPRADMVKPPRTDDAKYGADGRFTKVQEMKQVGVYKMVKTCKHQPINRCDIQVMRFLEVFHP